MNLHRTNTHKTKYFLGIFTLCTLFLFTACGRGDTSGTQARSDLTTEHVRGLYSGMMRKDIEDLLGTSDTSLAAKETIEVYSLADGSTAILRYHDDTLRGAYIRDKENNETPLFGYNSSGSMDNVTPSPTPDIIQEESSGMSDKSNKETYETTNMDETVLPENDMNSTLENMVP